MATGSSPEPQSTWSARARELALSHDPVSELIEEMVESGPSSVLDLAERLNDEQGHFYLEHEPPSHRAANQQRARGSGVHRPGGPGSGSELVDTLAPVARTGAGADRAPVARTGAGADRAPVARTGAGADRAPVGRSGAGAGRAPVGRSGAGAGRAPVGGEQNFAHVLERIARDNGLISPDGLHASREPARSPSGPEQQPARHSPAITAELPNRSARPLTHTGERHGPDRPSTSHAASASSDQRASQAASQVASQAASQVASQAASQVASQFVPALAGLGLPAAALVPVSLAITNGSAISLADVETALCRALSQVLAPLPPLPATPSSVVAVVGPRGQVMASARAFAKEIGAPSEEVVLATQRNVWRKDERVVTSPDGAREERRSWRWREHPAVVAVETPLRPYGNDWAADLLRALEPTLCWGVVEGSRKPEDVAAWSASLGGLDALAVVDVCSTTTPAAALGGSVPVGRIDGQEATPEAWAKLLCSRLFA